MKYIKSEKKERKVFFITISLFALLEKRVVTATLFFHSFPASFPQIVDDDIAPCYIYEAFYSVTFMAHGVPAYIITCLFFADVFW